MFEQFKILLCVLIKSKLILSINETEVYTINTKGCIIRAFPLISQSIENFVNIRQEGDDCNTKKHFLLSNSTHIYIDVDYLDTLQTFTKKELTCCYRNFQSHNYLKNVIYSECIDFVREVEAKHEFVRVECYYFGDKVSDEFFTFPYFHYEPRDDTFERYNIILIGIENMSRLNFHRTLPLTSEYLREKGSIEMQGFNKLGSNSFPNLIPMFTGRSFKEFRRECLNNDFINEQKCPFIWQKFKDSGYLTALGSDSMAGLLGHIENNMTKIPTDFYLQPLMYETRKVFKSPSYPYHQCLGNQYFFKVLLNYVSNLTKVLKNESLFGIFWEESISHDFLNEPYKMDEGYLEFFKNLEETSYLNNSIIIIFSDHGMRWGDIALTAQGRQEERLPLLHFLFPDSFKKRFPRAYKNIQDNSHRLITPYDLYETLHDLKNLSFLKKKTNTAKLKLPKSLRRSSLFQPISRRRTCKSVGIDEHWCTCDTGDRLKVGDLVRIQAAHVVLAHINRLLSVYPQCKKLNIGKILHASSTSREIGEGQIYNVVIQTDPDDALLDGTVKQQGGKWTVSGTISRLNSYRNQTCIDHYIIKAYCFCGEEHTDFTDILA